MDIKNMRISDDGIALLKRLEGCVTRGGIHVVYDDETGRPVVGRTRPTGATIGYGHLLLPGEDFNRGITDAAADALLRHDIAHTETAVRDNIHATVSQNQFDALVIFVYNIGVRNFANSTVVKYINNPSFHSRAYPTLEMAWRAWNRTGGCVSTGLINRRDAEWKMYTGQNYAAKS